MAQDTVNGEAESREQWRCWRREKIHGRFAVLALGFEGLYQAFMGFFYGVAICPIPK